MSTIRRNIIYNTILTGAHYAFPLIVYPYVSRVLGVSNIGLVGFIDSIATWFILFSMMGISTVGIREVARCGDNRLRRKQVFLSLLSLHAVITAIAVTAMIIVTFAVDRLRDQAPMMWIGVSKLVFNLFLIEWFYRGIEDFRYITYRSLLIRGSYVVAVFLFVNDRADTLTYYALTMLVVAATAIANIWSVRPYLSRERVRIRLFQFIKPFLFLGAYELMMAAYTTLNTTYLGFVSTDAEVGYYATASKLMTILMGVYISFSGVLMPRMSSLVAEGDIIRFRKYFKKACMIVVAFSVPVIAIVEIFAPEVIMLLSGPGYGGAVLPLRIMIPFLLIMGLEQLLTLHTLMPLGREKQILVIVAAAAATAVGAALLLVPSLGAIGSACVWAAAESVVFIGSAITLAIKRLKPTT